MPRPHRNIPTTRSAERAPLTHYAHRPQSSLCAALVLTLGSTQLVACAGADDDLAPIPQTSGMSLTASLSTPSAEEITVRYTATNTGTDPLIVTDLLGTRDSTVLPEPAPQRAYLFTRRDGSVEVAKWPVSRDAPPESIEYLMLGTRVEPGDKVSGTVLVERPLRSELPFTASTEITVDEPRAWHFCLGVMDPDKIDADLQANTTPEQPVIALGETVQIICSPLGDL